jgi:hypothetical protein
MTMSIMPKLPEVEPPASSEVVHNSTKPAMIGSISKKMEPPRLILNAVEGFGKTTFGAFSPKPVILMARGETGYQTLLSKGKVPDVPGAYIDTWPQLLATVEDLRTSEHDRKTVVLDASGGFERLMHEDVTRRYFDGDPGPKGFLSYHKGFEVAVNDWIQLLAALERLRAERKMMVIFLSHCKIKPFKNPLGEDFDRFSADVHEKTWGPTHKWSDAALFGNFFTTVQKNKGDTKGKGTGGTIRVVYTERRDAYDAKNRYGMDEMIRLPKGDGTQSDGSQNFATIWQQIIGDK